MTITPLARWDPAVLALVDRDRFDNQPIDVWLENPTVAEARKAFLLNALARLRAATLIAFIRRIVWIGDERMYCEVDPHLRIVLTGLSAQPARPWYHEGNPTSAIHQRLLRDAGLSHYVLDSFRQEGPAGLQIVCAVPDGMGPSYADIDIDLGNPLQDLVGFLIHADELITGGDTDQWAVRDRLVKGPAAPFLYYAA